MPARTRRRSPRRSSRIGACASAARAAWRATSRGSPVRPRVVWKWVYRTVTTRPATSRLQLVPISAIVYRPAARSPSGRSGEDQHAVEAQHRAEGRRVGQDRQAHAHQPRSRAARATPARTAGGGSRRRKAILASEDHATAASRPQNPASHSPSAHRHGRHARLEHVELAWSGRTRRGPAATAIRKLSYLFSSARPAIAARPQAHSAASGRGRSPRRPTTPPGASRSAAGRPGTSACSSCAPRRDPAGLVLAALRAEDRDLLDRAEPDAQAGTVRVVEIEAQARVNAQPRRVEPPAQGHAR